MPRIAHFILVDAPRSRVYAFAANYRNLPRIQAEFQTVRLLTPHDQGPGAQVEAHGRFRGMPVTARMTIVEATPPDLLASDSTGAVRSRTVWRFQEVPAPPDGPARTRVTLSIDYEIQVPALALLGALVQRDLDGMAADALRRLKVLVEHAEAAGPEGAAPSGPVA